MTAVYRFFIPCFKFVSHYHLPFLYTHASAHGSKSIHFGAALDVLSNDPPINANCIAFGRGHRALQTHFSQCIVQFDTLHIINS